MQTKTYEADMGHAAGGVFNTTARSGSNTWHGCALLVSKPGWATGQLYFAKRAGMPNPPQYYYNWAGSRRRTDLKKNKTFFWFSTDDYKQRSTRNNVLTLPTALERGGDFSQTLQRTGQLVTIYDPLTTRTGERAVIVRDPFPGNMIPAEPHQPGRKARCSRRFRPGRASHCNGHGVVLDDGPQNQETIKVDQRWNDRWTTTGMYAHQHTRAGVGLLRRLGSVPGDPGASLLLRTVDFVALNNIFVPNNTHDHRGPLRLQPVPRQRRQLPGIRRRHRSACRPAYVDAMTFNTFPSITIDGLHGDGRHRQRRPEQRRPTTPVGQRHGVEADRPSHLEVGGEYRRIGADVLAYGASAGTSPSPGLHAGESDDGEHQLPATRSPASCSAIPRAAASSRRRPAHY